MSSAPIPTSASTNPLLASVMASMHEIAPLSLADRSWDNVGLLLEASRAPSRGGVFLAIDLTTAVCDELIASNAGVAVVYHPLIFRGLKSIILADPQQRSVLRLIEHGISLYCPHTSLDATRAGINDWLAAVVSFDRLPDFTADVAALQTDWSPIVPAKEADANGKKGAGMGRLVNLPEPVPFHRLVQRVKTNLDLTHVQGSRAGSDPIRTVAVCAGSGSSVFRGVTADVVLTGELSHHEILAYVAAGTSVIVTNHTNTERKYLRDVLQHRLRALLPTGTPVHVSQADADPLTVL